MKTEYAYRGSLAGIILFASLLFAACKKDDDVQPPPQPSMDELYAHSITDAMIADSSERVDSLWAITAENTGLEWKTINGRKYVLVATFMRFPSSYPAGDSITNTWGDSWVFIPAQMKRGWHLTLKPAQTLFSASASCWAFRQRTTRAIPILRRYGYRLSGCTALQATRLLIPLLPGQYL